LGSGIRLEAEATEVFPAKDTSRQAWSVLLGCWLLELSWGKWTLDIKYNGLTVCRFSN
jgi:hypothetical protein